MKCRGYRGRYVANEKCTQKNHSDIAPLVMWHSKIGDDVARSDDCADRGRIMRLRHVVRRNIKMIIIIKVQLVAMPRFINMKDLNGFKNLYSSDYINFLNFSNV